MIRLLCVTFCVVITVSSATDVFIINTKPGGRSPQVSLSLDRLRTLQDLLKSQNGRSTSDFKPLDLVKFRNRNPFGKKAQYRLFRNMYGIHPKKLKTLVFKKAAAPLYEHDENDPFIKFLLSNQIPQLNQFEDATRDEHSFSDDYIDIGEVSRVKPSQSFSQDYIDFRNVRSLRKNEESPKETKPEIRTFSVESDGDDSRETQKSKRFEIIKNKHNKKDIKSSESEEAKYKKKKAKFKKSQKKYAPASKNSDESTYKKKKKYVSKEKYGSSLSSDVEKDLSRSGEYAKKKSKKKKKHEIEENDEWNENKQPVELYLQGNKLVMYPPMDPISEETSDDTRRMRLPYFLPKRYNWHPDEIHNLGYFFFDGPKGFSNER